MWKKQSEHPNLKRIECPAHDPIQDWKPDPSGVYVLIRVSAERRVIELALCDREHKIFRIFTGKTCQDVYHAVFEEEKRSGAAWFQSPAHIAYLGKELKKAELALEHNQPYLQE
jgi:hypothetical protein